jgi:SAM-dependent methyltransferase
MHAEAFEWTKISFEAWYTPEIGKIKVLEFGSLDINGSIRSIFEPHASVYTGVDPQPGPGVDVVCGAHDFYTLEVFDVVVACEVFEHTPLWREITTNAHRLLRDGGLFIATMAGEGREPHSAVDAGPIRDWEYYDNVGRWELNRHLSNTFASHEINTLGTDIRCVAVKITSQTAGVVL